MARRTAVGIIIAAVLGFFPVTAVFYLSAKVAYSGTAEPLHGFRLQFPVMGTVAGFTLYTADRETFLTACRAGKNEFAEVVKIANLRDPASELSRLNASAADRPFSCSREMWQLLLRAEKAWHDSNGSFDITIKPLMDIWGFYRKQNRIPSDAETAQTRQRTGFDKLHFDRIEKTVKFTVPGMALDLGGIAKGYAVDRAAAAIEKCGVHCGVVDLGGNLKLLPQPPPGKKYYSIGIRNPAKRGELLPDALQLPGGRAVATSGDYERFVTYNSIRYGHIIDPHTGKPQANPAVTVITASALDADIFSTSAYLGKIPVAEKLKKLYPESEFHFFPAAN